jgi:hypothetical protein
VRSAQALDRALGKKNFNAKVEYYCSEEKISKTALLTENNLGQLFLPPTLAVLLAGEVCPMFGVHIGRFYVETRPQVIAEAYAEKLTDKERLIRTAGLTALLNVG